MLESSTADIRLAPSPLVKPKYLIITADDFGLWPEINDAVMAGYDAGIITSASLRVTGREAHSAAVSATMRPGLGVGLQNLEQRLRHFAGGNGKARMTAGPRPDGGFSVTLQWPVNHGGTP